MNLAVLDDAGKAERFSTSIHTVRIILILLTNLGFKKIQLFWTQNMYVINVYHKKEVIQKHLQTI